MAGVVFGEAEPRAPDSPHRSDHTLKPSESDLAIEQTGMIIGRYKLLEQIGEGGFGVVYMAEQVEPVQRKVALKVVKAGMDTRAVVVRFEAERQALALMDHPNIAKVYDGGTTGSPASQPSTLNDQLSLGRPYFVMELVKGIPITEFCDQKHLSTAERLKLFIQVCSAVQHAHQKGIIHRDLKPSNILVTLHDGKPVAKVIDFGVAKALGQRLTEKTLFTGFAHMVGTPAYMSPEQAELSGLDVDTRSDVYSLGVLLYELLTGVTPFDRETLAKAALDEVRRMIREVEPVKPSTRLTQERLRAASGKSAIRNPRSEIDKDLDWIVMRCLEKDRTRRYETVNGLAMDVQRHLAEEPVVARPPSQVYLLQKTVRRHKFGFAAAAAIVLVLALGVVISTWEAVRASRAEEAAGLQAERSAQVAQFLKDMLSAAGPSVARGRDATLLREVLEKTARRVESDLQDQPEVQGDLWFTLGMTYHDIGDRRSAMPMFAHAADSYRLALGEESPKLALALTKLGRTQSFIGQMAIGSNNAYLGLQMARKGGDPRAVADALLDMGCSIAGRGDTAIEGAPYLREAVAIREQLGDDPVALAACMSRLADSLNKALDPEAEPLAREALKLTRRHLGTDHPETAAAVFVLGQVLLNMDKLDEAETVLREALRLYQDIHDPTHPYQHYVHTFLCVAYARQQKWEEAEAVLMPRIRESDSWEASYYLAFVGAVRVQKGDWAGAAESFARAVELTPNDGSKRLDLAVALLRAGREEEYRIACHRFLAVAREADDFTMAAMAAKASLVLPVAGADFDEACRLADFAIGAAPESETDHPDELLEALTRYRRGDLEGAATVAGNLVSSENTAAPLKAAASSILALVQTRQDKATVAREAFMQGDNLANEPRPRFDFPVQPRPRFDFYVSMHWRDRAIAEILREEAVALLEATSFTTNSMSGEKK